ncbi:MAG: PH domain-containing protein [Bacteroidia bacterium]
MRSVFKSGRSIFTTTIFWGSIALLLGLFANDVLKQNLGSTWYYHVFDSIVIAFLLWVWFRTDYAFYGENLVCNAGPFNANIKINSIRAIDLNTKMWSGFRPALSFKGMVIYYEKYNEIFISPKDIEGFISVLKRINPTIQINQN